MTNNCVLSFLVSFVPFSSWNGKLFVTLVRAVHQFFFLCGELKLPKVAPVLCYRKLHENIKL